MYKEEVTAGEIVIVIPVYRDYLSAYELISLKQGVSILAKYKIVVVKPRSLKLTIFNDFPFIEYISFNDNCFLDVDSYSRLMMSAKFYQEFLSYKYMLIYQLDAFVFKDELLHWCNLDYDYVGAPWLKDNDYTDAFHYLKSKILIFLSIRYNKKMKGKDELSRRQFENQVGNGGFSLRRIERFYQLACEYADQRTYNHLGLENWLPEDVFWAISINRLKTNLKIPGYKQAIRFSFENTLERAFALTNNVLPFGCHAWDRHTDFWHNIFIRHGYDI